MTVTRIAASKAQAWAVGVECAAGFQPRRIVWGRILARAEKRKGEAIVPVVLATPEERDADIVEAVQATLSTT